MPDEARVRLHAHLNNDLVPIAFCRHAQARILVREGQAAWNDGRLVLTDAIAARYKDQHHPALAACYEGIDRRAKYALKTLDLADRTFAVIESVFGPDLPIGNVRQNGYGETIISFNGTRTPTGSWADGWIEVWEEAFTIYIDRWAEPPEPFVDPLTKTTHSTRELQVERRDLVEDLAKTDPRMAEELDDQARRPPFGGGQESIHIASDLIHRIGDSGDKTPENKPGRWRNVVNYTPTGDLLDSLAFELAVMRAILLDPNAPSIIEHPVNGPLVASDEAD